MTYSCVMVSAAAQPPEKTVNVSIHHIVIDFLPKISLNLARITITAAQRISNGLDKADWRNGLPT